MSRYRRHAAIGDTHFFTVNLADRRTTLLVDHIDQLRSAFVQVRQRHPFQTLAICVLPNHLHAIWRLPENHGDFSVRWQQIKRAFSSHFTATAERSESKINKREKGIWQRRFWAHAITDEADLAAHMQYVHFNPVKHGLVTNVEDWPYSSYHRWLRNQHATVPSS